MWRTAVFRWQKFSAARQGAATVFALLASVVGSSGGLLPCRRTSRGCGRCSPHAAVPASHSFPAHPGNESDADCCAVDGLVELLGARTSTSTPSTSKIRICGCAGSLLRRRAARIASGVDYFSKSPRLVKLSIL